MKTFYNRFYEPRAHQNQRFEPENEEPSQTVQGEVLSISDLLKREINGMPIGRRPVQYMEVEDINEIHQWYRPITDLTDFHQLQEHHKALEMQIEAFEKYKKEQDKKDPENMEIFNEPKKQEKPEPKKEE